MTSSRCCSTRPLLDKAAADTAAVEELLDSERVIDDVVGFHAQQACEKLLKAVLGAAHVRYRYTHDLAELIDLLTDAALPVPDHLHAVIALTPFAVTYRYEDLPGEEDPLDRGETLRLVRSLRHLAEEVISSEE
ncbi:MAG: HEPN domain-containing protein [Egibacteraceae bacterium]